MSTCCVVRFVEAGKPLYAFYKHCDGADFKETLENYLKYFTIGQGIPMTMPDGEFANGLDCLAAQVIANFKEGAGDIYLCHPSDEGDYTYEITVEDDRAVLTTVEDK